MYDRLWPEPVHCPFALVLHWSHSILSEPTFMSPWSAIETASDLACEMGYDSKLRIDQFVLPTRGDVDVEVREKQPCKVVRFAESPQAFQGKGAPEQFPQESVRHYDGQPISQFWHSPRSCPIDPTGGSKSQASSSRDATSSSNRHFLDRRLPQELPNYVNHLQHLWRDNHLRIAEGEHYCVRTWYIHHTHHPVWRVPRFIDLTEDVLTWHRKVLSSWSDHIHNDELLNIAIATPEVRVQTTHKQHHADLVLIQGDPERKGAIITVYPPGVEEHLSTTLAVSLPEHVSGMDVITGAEAQDLLLSHACDVFHAGFQLPIGTVPTHWMANGHTFVVIFQDMQTETNNEIESALPALSSETIDQAETLDEEPIEN